MKRLPSTDHALYMWQGMRRLAEVVGDEKSRREADEQIARLSPPDTDEKREITLNKQARS